MNIQIPSAPLQVIRRLNQKGFEAYAVGGCVRDALLGRVAQDWDICTNALPEETCACFEDMHTIPTGVAHGTVTVVIDRQPMEVTTYRVDGAYSDCRHPDGVTFTRCLEEDLARRDFTINAMAYHPEKGLVDLYGGRDDLKAGVVRCVGEASLRFQEDALRILRCLRFASVLDFSIDRQTAQALEEKKSLLSYVATERVYNEVTKLICSKAAGRIIDRYSSVLELVLPGFGIKEAAVKALPLLPDEPALRYAALYFGEDQAGEWMRELRAPKNLARQVGVLAAAQHETPPKTLLETRKMVYRLGMEDTRNTLRLQKAFGYDTACFEKALREIQEKSLCCRIAELAINGKDLLELGVAAGEGVGQTLEQLMFAVMEEQVDNRAEDLLDCVKTRLMES